MPLFAYFYNMKYAIAIIGNLCVFTSCQYFLRKKISSGIHLFREEVKSINWTDVDTFPAFPGCDDLIAQEASEELFQKTITQSFGTSAVPTTGGGTPIHLGYRVVENGSGSQWPYWFVGSCHGQPYLGKDSRNSAHFQESLEALPKTCPPCI